LRWDADEATLNTGAGWNDLSMIAICDISLLSRQHHVNPSISYQQHSSFSLRRLSECMNRLYLGITRVSSIVHHPSITSTMVLIIITGTLALAQTGTIPAAAV
jgi:hypothetical protein